MIVSVLSAGLLAFAVQGVVRAVAAGDAASGKTVFTSNGCGGCHTLADAGAKGKSASNFDNTKPGFDAVVAAVTKPPTGMPPNSLSADDIQNVAAYIVDAAGKQAPGGNTGGGNTGGGSSNAVKVTLKGWKIKISTKKVSAGSVAFVVKNSDKRWHQLAIKRVPSASKGSIAKPSGQSSASRKSKGGSVMPCRVGKSGLTANLCKILPRHTRHLTRDLRPGKYKLINTAPTCQWSCTAGRYRYAKGKSVTLRVTAAETAASITPPAAAAGLSAEAQAFVDAGCGGCHTLADARTTSTVASNLDIGKPSLDTVRSVVTNGITNNLNKGVVPTKVNPMPYAGEDNAQGRGADLSPEQIESMASYVSRVTGGGDGSDQPAGRQTVLRTGCGACHTLSATDGKASRPAVDGVNPTYSYTNLDLAKPSKETVRLFVKNVTTVSGADGRAGGTFASSRNMPLFSAPNTSPPDPDRQKNITTGLTTPEIDDVATYVSNATSGGPNGDTQTGKQEFLVRGCAGCHPLADVGMVKLDWSNLNIAKPNADTIKRILETNMGMVSSTSSYPPGTLKRYGLTPGMPNYSGQSTPTTVTTRPIDEPERSSIATYLSTVTGGTGEDPASGRQLSLVGGCGRCHKIAETGGTDGNKGMDFDESTPTVATTHDIMTTGFGTQPPPNTSLGMPMYLNNVDTTTYGPDANTKLTAAEIDLVATFINTFPRS